MPVNGLVPFSSNERQSVLQLVERLTLAQREGLCQLAAVAIVQRSYEPVVFTGGLAPVGPQLLALDLVELASITSPAMISGFSLSPLGGAVAGLLFFAPGGTDGR